MKNIDNAPMLVKAALLGINSRMSAMIYMGICIVLAAILVIYASPIYAIFLGLAAAWYAYAIRWVDKNGSWTKPL